MRTQNQDEVITQAIVDTFNRFHPVGSEVAYVDDLGRVHHTTVSGPATVMASGTAVVWLSGRAGAYSLSRVIPIDERSVAVPSVIHLEAKWAVAELGLNEEGKDENG